MMEFMYVEMYSYEYEKSLYGDRMNFNPTVYYYNYGQTIKLWGNGICPRYNLGIL